MDSRGASTFGEGIMAEIVAIHGIFQEQLGAHQLLRPWNDALQDGLEAAGGRGVPAPEFAMAYYGRLFLTQDDAGRPVTKGPSVIHDASNVRAIDELDLDSEEEAFLTAAAFELHEVTSPDQAKARVPAAARPLTRLLAQRVDGRMTLSFVSALRQVRLYLTDDGLATQARAEVEHIVADGCRVLVGHSLGSVVAFEVLALRPDLEVDTLITLGSPLAMKTVASRLRAGTADADWALPGGVRRWVNAYDEGDAVSAAGRVGKLWPQAEDYTVTNGDHPHDATRYLGKRITGQTILEAVPRLNRSA